MASRQAAAGTSRGGRTTIQIAMPSPAADFRSQDTPSATPEPVIPVIHEVSPGQGDLAGGGDAAGRAARARASRISASTGGSVVITARLSPTTGEATATAVASSAS